MHTALDAAAPSSRRSAHPRPPLVPAGDDVSVTRPRRDVGFGLVTAIPTMQEELGASASQIRWILDAYAIVFAGSCSPLAHWATGSKSVRCSSASSCSEEAR